MLSALRKYQPLILCVQCFFSFYQENSFFFFLMLVLFDKGNGRWMIRKFRTLIVAKNEI